MAESAMKARLARLHAELSADHAMLVQLARDIAAQAGTASTDAELALLAVRILVASLAEQLS